ncbi:FAD-linked sulfhydryl oxidase ERV2 [Cercospora zeina]
MGARRYYTVLTLVCFIVFFAMLGGMRTLRQSVNKQEAGTASRAAEPLRQTANDAPHPGQLALTGHAIAPKLGNETAKAELGRATWKFFHTVMARFPEKPTEEESNTLRTFIYSFQRVYPCGDCATHFGELLKKFPPQVSSRNAAAGWACHVHNQVNIRLHKEEFDCNNIGDFYDCGCAKDEEDEKKEKEAAAKTTEIQSGSTEKPEMSTLNKEKYAVNGRDFNEDLVFT